MLFEFIAEMLTLIGVLIVGYFIYVLITKKDDKQNADSPTMAHTALREVVERVIEEARKLPSLGSSGASGKVQDGRSVAEHSYEDLLATAILNKVIEKFQKEQVDGNSNVLPGKPVSAAKCASNESEAGLDEGVEEGCSSLEPLSQDDCSSDCSTSCLRRVRNQPQPLSLTIEERIEEVTTTYASDEDHRENDVLNIKNSYRVPFPELGMDIIDPSQESEDSQDEPDTPTTHIGLVSPIESWEENWLFQKKRVSTQADSVTMLVPNPSADFKALIGDKDAEDTSDLSECSAQSDEEIEKELMEAINNVVPRSPKKTGLENGLDHCSNSPHEISSKENCVKTISKEVSDQINLKNVTKQKRKNGEHTKKSGAKDIEENKSERVEAENGKLVSVPINVISENTKTEHQTMLEVSKGDKTIDLIKDENLIEPVSESGKKSEINLNTSTIPLAEENGLDVPKTPTPTPTGISSSMISAENEETFCSRDENVLNSLERAKKKLMAVNDDTAEMLEETGTTEQKVDFHAEDIQQESEYTEHYDTATQRHLDSLTKTETSEPSLVKEFSTENEESKCREAVAIAKADSASHQSLNKNSEKEVQLATPPRPGTIAEREHKKWENAPPIENNPYSQENIQKRLWERQYSRRPSDIPGMHPELQQSNGEDLDVVLTPPEPDIKRFGRDYYINGSRASSNDKGRKSGASNSSRPGSSLSQRSNSTGNADQDQQVSFQLEKFEEASLRGSLSRRALRDPYSSPHFAVNPLLRMELESTDNIHEKTESSDENSFEHTISKKNDESLRVFEIKPDRDSGTYSDLENKKQDSWRRLWIDEWQSKNDQIFSFNGKKYCNLNGHEYHTFGGIKSLSTGNTEDSDEDKETRDEFFDPVDFAKLKFQTFGGIKKNKKIDGKGVAMYRRTSLKSFRSYKNSKGIKPVESDCILREERNENFDSDSCQSEYEGSDANSKLSERQAEMTSYQSSIDDDWQDVHVPDKLIMRKFLNDASKKLNSRSNFDNDSSYFVNTSRRKMFDVNPRKIKLQKHRSLDDNESLKLEPPIVPEVVEKTFETLQDLRVKGRKKKHKSPEPKKKLGVRSLSDLTIW